ncbi:protein kinase domain-containing protein [Artemisia annua]|uniref:Protein kinase domain-containing protein n=1 Tax=Artemisia annua TaxID=35608 RepID=A0A2U1M6D1_ARTAN|nr:protein kinase domain-containing protein [Artemisia annua]
MLTFCLPFLSLLLLFTTTTTAQPYKATDHFLLNCGSSTTSTSDSNQRWDGDEHSINSPSDITATSFSSNTTFRDPSVPTVPYSTARIIINTSSFNYRFPVSEGPKFLRLYFYPATYSGLTPNQSFFSVSSNGYSLLTNFSAFQTASFLAKKRSDAGVNGPPVPHFVKEFLIFVKDNELLNVVFSPVPNSYAFINGIEIVSMPDNLYFDNENPKPVGMNTGPVINDDTALETVYRLNMGGGQIPSKNDTGMYRFWDQDNNYVYGSIGLTPIYDKPITYTVETPNYTAPEAIYQTQRSMGNQSDLYNLTWILPMVFTILINNQTAEEEADLFRWTSGTGYPIYKDYVVFVNSPSGDRSKQDLWLEMHPNSQSEEYRDAYLNGLEAFKLSINHNLSIPIPSPNLVKENNKTKTPSSALIIGGAGGGLVLLSVLLVLVLYLRKRTKHHTTTNNKPSPPSDCCHRFSLRQVKVATNKFNENNVIGNGGFGKVYKGYIGSAKTTVAIKRLNPSSSQGFHEFQTEIQMLSRLCHEHLVSLIGYCDDNGEMILVYDYMARGNLREHLYKTNNPPLSWKTQNLIKGSIGYIDPEYCKSQHLREKSDVYSFGVNLSCQIAPGCLRKFGEVANSCLHEEGIERPTMDAVVQGLEVALQLQEACEEMGEEMLESQELPSRMQVELTKTDDDGIEDGEIVAHQVAHS